MKKALLLCWAFLGVFTLVAQDVSFTSVEVLSSDATTTRLKFSVDGFQSKTVQTPNGPALVIYLENGTPLLKAGAPDLPKLTASIVIDDVKNTIVSVESFSFTDYDNVEVAPSKGNLYRNVDPATVPYTYGDLYQQDAFFPADLVNAREPFIFRDFRGQTIVVHPVQYNPVAKKLRVYEELVIKVKTLDGVGLNPLYRSQASIAVNPDFQQLYKNRFLNLNQVEDRYEQLSELGNMLVVSHGEYLPTLEPLIEWKKQKGIPVEVVDMATIGSSAADLQAFVADYYATNGLTYLLLVGDEHTVPTLQTSSNNACDMCYGYQLGDDHYAELFVGRFNAETVAHVQTMVDRNMYYEANPVGASNPDWFSTGLGLGSDEGPGDDNEFDYEHLNNLKIQMLDYNYTKVWEFYGGSQAGASPTPGDVTTDQNGSPSTSSIVDAVDAGLSIFNYTGHGDHSVLATGGFNNAAINSLVNEGMYPFLIAVACCVGDFQNDFGSGPCLGDAWIRATDNVTGAPTGGIGGCFSSILQSWSPPMEGQDEMTKLITESAQYDIRHTLGGIVLHGCGSMIDEYGGGGEEMADTWNIFGDPSVVLWTKQPEGLTVTHAPVLNVGSTQLDVYADVEDAMVGLYYQGEILGTGMIQGGLASISFEPVVEPEEITVTVTAYNKLPYQGPVQVVVSQGPYVILNAHQLHDPTGNNNQLADYGESILLDMDLSNVGVALASDVEVTLSTADANVTITDNTATYGDLAANETASLPGAFAFEVADLISDQHVVLFDVTISSGATDWSATLPITLQAPELKAAPVYEVVDVLTGNGNGRMDAGEQFVLEFEIENQGNSVSPDAVGTLTSSSPYVTVVDANLPLGALAANGTTIPAAFTIEVAADVPFMEPVVFTLTVDAAPYGVQELYNGRVNLIVEDFETNNFETFEWTNESPAPWFITNTNPYEGTTCSQSGLIQNDQATDLTLTLDVLEDGEISFAYRASTEEGWDFLEFYIDGNILGGWSGETGWQTATYPVLAGTHTFTWKYEKDEIFSSGADAAWIDEIILPLIYENIIDGVAEVTLGSAMSIHPTVTNNTAWVGLNIEATTKGQLVLLNSFGQQLQVVLDERSFAAGQYQQAVQLAAYPAGVYYLSFQTDGQWITKRVVKQ